ncbi:laccase [Vararia minispora EC-137]|uniref:Laccase n=1 Tax=Vararia minispora EC-137 TaxID=1314806 RepID=A0ACB8QWA9_9AGAM|nr:laccase [Vararia minispora EC-137]
MRLVSTLPLLASLSTPALAATVSQTLNIVNTDLSVDGFARSTVVANGNFPGPLISGNLGDNFEISVSDQLSDTSMDVVTTIHWHGFFQNKTNEMDGVTQCPIVPGNSFTYNFSSNSQAGTFWYHSHYRTQYCDGLRGPFVVYDPNDPHADLYDVDDASTVITLADWYHFVSPQASIVVVANSTLINGAGRYAGGSNTALSVITVKSGKRYRFRIVSLSCDPNFTFSIDNHTMTIIESDGVSTQPLQVDSLVIYAGQRYSAVVSADQAVGNYWVRALPNINGASYTNGQNSAILRYSGAATADPTTSEASSSPLVENNLHPLVSTPVPGPAAAGQADIQLTLNLGFSFQTGTAFEVNGVPMQSPSVPVLLQILSGNTTASNLLPSGSVYTLERNKVVEIVIPGGAAGSPHPFHLHGHTFWVVRSAGNDTYNFVDPVVRDVVSTGVLGDQTTIRFVTDNPGPWFLHCHIDWHLNLGLGVVLAEAPTDVASNEMTNWEALCPSYNSFTGTS